MRPRVLSSRLPAPSVRLLNTDRNDGNILIRYGERGALSLIPIDHGYALPDCITVNSYDLCWYNWKQLRVRRARAREGSDAATVATCPPLARCGVPR